MKPSAPLQKMFTGESLNLEPYHPCSVRQCNCDLPFTRFALREDAESWAKEHGFDSSFVIPARNKWADCFVIGRRFGPYTFFLQGYFRQVSLAYLSEKQDSQCPSCQQIALEEWGPSHRGKSSCKSFSLASGGERTHCTCDICF